jgi:hypothetical protein
MNEKLKVQSSKKAPSSNSKAPQAPVSASDVPADLALIIGPFFEL